METGTVTFFNIDEAGFYKVRKNDKPNDLIDGSCSEILHSVNKWKDKQEFLNTVPWDIRKHKKRDVVYCRSIAHSADTDDFVFVMWKRVGDESGKMHGIDEKAGKKEKKGDSVSLNSKTFGGKSLVYGQPMYYWFIPKLDLVASIKFPYSISDKELMTSYIKRCVENRVDHPNRKKNIVTREHPVHGADAPINNVTFESSCGKHKSLRFSFKASEKRVNIYNTDLNKLAPKITHIVVRDVIAIKNFDNERSEALKLYNKVMKKRKNNVYERRVEIETEVFLTPAELQEMLDLYQDEYDPTTPWVNMGFKEGKEDSPSFFNSYIERTDIIMDPSKKHENTHYTAEDLLTELTRQRNSLLASFIEQAKMNGTN